ncbi:hypothetical protein [Streptomyces achromogenes]|uniref:hypothetical protein n=1 Tax=Streptomyces achromogenes TaxID=67255 RepID=UPI0036C95C2B
MAVYPRAHLIDVMRTRARRSLRQARSWREEAGAFMSYFTPRQCRAHARQELLRAGCYRRRLLVFMNEPGQYVTKERHDQIMRGQW